MLAIKSAETPPASRLAPRDEPSWLSMLGSLLLHAGLLLILFWLLPSGSGGNLARENLRRGEVVLAKLDEQTEKLTYDDQTSAQQPAAASQDALPVETQPPDVVQERASNSDSLSAPPDLAGWSIPDAGSLTNPINQQGNPLLAELSEADLKAIREEQRRLAAMGPAGPPATLSLFGSRQITGQRFVFVLDRSKSMGAQGLGVLGRARGELASALRGLEPHHAFQIVAFHHETVLMDRREMLPATRENANRVADFITQLAPLGGTNYEGALYTALALSPDVIILFSDGDEPGLNPAQTAAIVRACRGSTQIHCLQFGWETAEPKRNFLHDLAENSGGSYRFVSIPAWDKDQ